MKNPTKKPAAPAETFHLTPNYLFTVVMSWLVPGAGHWLLGYRVRATVIGVTLIGTFWCGESVLAENMAVTRRVHWVFFSLQAGNGASAFVANHFWGEPVVSDDTRSIQTDLPRHINLGILFCTISGLLNALVVLHILDPRTWKEAEADARERLARQGQGQENEA